MKRTGRTLIDDDAEKAETRPLEASMPLSIKGKLIKGRHPIKTNQNKMIEEKQQKNKNYRRQKKMEVLKISSKSNPNSVAGAIAGLVKESNKAEMQAIGAGALNQAVKAVAIARGFVAPAGVDLVCIPAFAEVEVEGEDRTGIKLIVESRG